MLLHKFLEKHRVMGNSDYTHVSLGTPMGKFNLEGVNYHIFMLLYKEAIETTNNLYLAEKQNDVGPLILDIDLRQNDKHRLYTQNHIRNIVAKFEKIIRVYVEIDSDFDIEAFILEKNEPYYDNKQDIYKDGFHITYPNLNLDIKLREIIFDSAISELKSEDIFKDIQIMNNYDDIFDKHVLRTCWMLYGSRKPTKEPYKLTQKYMNNVETNHDYYFNDDLVSVLSVRKPQSRIFKVRDAYNKLFESKIDISNDDPNVSNMNTDINLDHIKQIVKNFSIKCATDYCSWFRVCGLLKSIDESLYDDFIEFSKKCPEKYNKSHCDSVWNKAKKFNNPIQSLIVFSTY